MILNKLTSSEVAKRLGISRKHLIVIINRHKDLRPSEKIGGVGFSAFLWSEEEVQSVELYINSKKRGSE